MARRIGEPLTAGLIAARRRDAREIFFCKNNNTPHTGECAVLCCKAKGGASPLPPTNSVLLETLDFAPLRTHLRIPSPNLPSPQARASIRPPAKKWVPGRTPRESTKSKENHAAFLPLRKREREHTSAAPPLSSEAFCQTKTKKRSAGRTSNIDVTRSPLVP